MKFLILAAVAIFLAAIATISRAQLAAAPPAKELTLDLGNGLSMKLALIPAGKFLMGSPPTEAGYDNDEIQHEVTISKPFYMAETHVTVDQFAQFVNDSGYRTDAERVKQSWAFIIRDGRLINERGPGFSWRSPGFEQKGDHPVVQTSWNDAQDFCSWLSQRSGKTVVLPTEAQWEYACRAGTTTAYPWGDNPDDGKGWADCADQSLKNVLPNAFGQEYFSWDDGFVYTAPVGSFKANAFGLYDMNGSALQWCQDWYGGPYDPGAVTDPTGPATGDSHVLRGGFWMGKPKFCRSAFRHQNEPGDYNNFSGFRVVVTDLK